MSESFDYVIVGGGSAGCVLASRLSEDPDVTVLLLEAGGWDTNPLIHIPIGLGKLHQYRMHDWRYLSEPEPHLLDRQLPVQRGKVLGGSSSINVMSYTRGDQADYDLWSAKGARGWSYAEVLPYFKRGETSECGEDDIRGRDGPLGVQWTRVRDPICDAWIEAGALLGYAENKDSSNGTTEGFGRIQHTIRNGCRSSSARAYLGPIRKRRKNLIIRTRVHVTRVVLERSRAVAVEYVGSRRDPMRVTAEREIILAGGAFNSPQILMLSGIGPADHLRMHGISVAADLPVGKNLQEHLASVNLYARTSTGEFHSNMRFDRMAVNMLRAYFLREGYATSIPSGVMGFIKTKKEIVRPDIEFVLPISPPYAHLWLRPFVKPYLDGFSIRAAILHPESRGEVTLRSANPFDSVRIQFNFLSAAEDMITLRRGFKIGRELARQRPLDSFRQREIAPGEHIQADDDIDEYIRKSVGTLSHAAGTCSMGESGAVVLDSTMRVRGIERLRVVDASAMPELTTGHINACVMMMAEKAADIIRGRSPALQDIKRVDAAPSKVPSMA